jgi:serine/threonine protein kinase
MQNIKQFEPLWGEWHSVQLLGHGSFGRVYKMVKLDMEKEYFAAVKHLSLPSEPGEEKNLFSEGLVTGTDQDTLKSYYDDVLKSLRSEIDLCYKLKGNTNIVSYEDHYIRPKSSGVGYDIFIKMELLTSLQDCIQEGGLAVWDMVKLGEDICRALTVLRREKIIHRDIKPGNIFINSGGDYKLGDFGVSRSIERMMSSMSRKGTMSYMAPEVANKGVGDYRVDIYSLGLVLYRMLNKNRAPFLPLPPQGVSYEENMQALERRLRGAPLPPPADADEALAAIILKSCAYQPEDRWQSAEEMGNALAQYRLSQQRVQALSPFEEVIPVPAPANPPPSVSPDSEKSPPGVPPMEPEEPPDPTTLAPHPIDETLTLKQSAALWMEKQKQRKNEKHQQKTQAEKRSAETAQSKPKPAKAKQTKPEPKVKATGAVPPLSAPAKTPPVPQPMDETMMLKQSAASRKEKQKQRKNEKHQQKTQAEKKQAEKMQAKPKPAKEKQAKPEPKTKATGVVPSLNITFDKRMMPVAATVGAIVLLGVIGIFALTNHSPKPEPQDKVSSAVSTSAASTPIPLKQDEPEPVLWQDPFIRDSVLEALGVTESELTPERLAGLEELCVPVPEPVPEGKTEPAIPASISTLADLAMLPGLRSLDLSGHPVEALDFPEEMPSLETLKLAGCGCTDLEFFSRTALENLRILDLSENEIADLSPLSGLSKLNELNITKTQAESLEPLRGLTELTVLSAQGIPAEDWSPVNNVAQVEGRPGEVVEEPEPEPEPSKPAEETQKPAATNPNNKPATTKPNNRPSTIEPDPTAVTSVSVSTSNTVLEVGGSTRLSASVSPSSAASQKVSWSSSNSSIATVDGSGNVNAVGRGTARITASCNGKSASCTITVD